MTGKELKSWRYQWKVTQENLSRMLGVHRVTIAKWEAGDRGIPPFLHLAIEALENRIKKENNHGSIG